MHLGSVNPDQNYVVALSGGVDSVVLLHLLVNRRPDTDFTVAHYDHAMRDDSVDDARFAVGLADHYGLRAIVDRASSELTSENAARQARYKFLNHVAHSHNARLITAHHLDDVIETTALNLNRGTGLRGVVNMLRGGPVLRPLINVSKRQIIEYATRNCLEWTQDPTNSQPQYTRNRLRSSLSHISDDERTRLHHVYSRLLANYNQQVFIMTILLQWLEYRRSSKGWDISRAKFKLLPALQRKAVIHHLLSQHSVSKIDQGHIQRLAQFTSVAENGKMYQLSGALHVKIAKNLILFESQTRNL